MACDDPQSSPVPPSITASTVTATQIPEPISAVRLSPTANPTPTAIAANTLGPSPVATVAALSGTEVLDLATNAVKGSHKGHIEGGFTLEAETQGATFTVSLDVDGIFQTPNNAHVSLTHTIRGTGSVDISGTQVDVPSSIRTEEWITFGDYVYQLDSFGEYSRHARDNIEGHFELSNYLAFDLLDSESEIATSEQLLEGERVYHLRGPAAQNKSYPVIGRLSDVDGVVDYWIGAEDHLLRRLEVSVMSTEGTNGSETVRLNGFITLYNYGRALDIRPPVSEGMDDHGNSPGDATEILLGESVTASVDTWLDSDYFQFQAEEGRLYHIVVSDQRGSSKAYGTHSTLFGPDGVTPASTFGVTDDQLGTRIVWQAPASDTYYLRVESGQQEVYVYNLTVSLQPEEDDYGDDPSSAHEIGFDEAVEGQIGQLHDRDFFKFTASEGHVYRIDASAHLERNEPDVTLHGPEGPLLEARTFSRGGIDTGRILWAAPSQGDYYISVEHRNSYRVGNYTLKVVPISAIDDDHNDNTANASQLAVGETIAGALEYQYDLDFFKFDGEKGQGYKVYIDYESVRFLDLILYSSDSLTPESLDKFTHEDRDGRRLLWMAPEAGTYYLEVKSLLGTTGEYSITVTQVEVGPDDHANVVDGATDIAFGETVHGSMDNEFDLDYFRLVAEEGRRYRVRVDHQGLGIARVVILAADGFTEPSRYSSSSSSQSGTSVRWEAEASSEYFIRVDSRSGNLGDYTIMLDQDDR